jgi:hypothetical protein
VTARRPTLRPWLRAALAALLTATVAIGFFTVTAYADRNDDNDELDEVRAATARFHQLSEAEEAGYGLLDGLDHCFENSGVGAMGYHYINTSLLDEVTDPRAPEALVYAPQPNGRLQLAAVEWIVPDPAPPAEEAPTVLGHDMHYNEGLEVWVHHAWIFSHNPRGMFDDWNPRVTCPPATE